MISSLRRAAALVACLCVLSISACSGDEGKPAADGPATLTLDLSPTTPSATTSSPASTATPSVTTSSPPKGLCIVTWARTPNKKTPAFDTYAWDDVLGDASGIDSKFSKRRLVFFVAQDNPPYAGTIAIQTPMWRHWTAVYEGISDDTDSETTFVQYPVEGTTDWIDSYRVSSSADFMALIRSWNTSWKNIATQPGFPPKVNACR